MTFKNKYTDEQFIDTLEKLGMSTTGEVAVEVGCKQRNASLRLADLHEREMVNRKKMGGRWIYYM